MKGKRTSVAGLLLSVVLLAAQGASAQEDSTRVRRDSLRTVGAGVGSPHVPVNSGLSGVGAEEYRPEPSLEAGREVPVFRPVRRDPDLRLPYQENPSLRFKGDFRTARRAACGAGARGSSTARAARPACRASGGATRPPLALSRS